MKKPTTNEIIDSFDMLDLHCAWYGSYKKNYITFDSDEKGNGNGPTLTLRLFEKYAKFVGGSHLTKDEKNSIFPYCDFDNIDEYADYLADFVIKYFKSIKLIFVRKQK